jgi:hypothetical protein
MASATDESLDRKHLLVVGGASAGTVFEWYDFYLYGSLATYITRHFFSGVNETTGYIFALLAFAAGFAVRPFGALVFGRLGDLWGRKNTFLVTMLLMGFSTFTVGLLPSYASIGVLAPVALITLRLLQGLAVGGEYGGAATYVAEHAPDGRRGFYTSWIQTTATLGLFLSLVVILTIRLQTGNDAFAAWGWRVPFLLSALLLGISLWIRLKLNESPVFRQMVAEGKTSSNPIRDSFANPKNLRLVLLALFGLTMGQAVVWYCGQFYALFFLERVLRVDSVLTNMLIAVALLLGTPMFILFGWLSDKVGRKPVILAGCLLAALTFFPLFQALTWAANPALAQAAERTPITVVAAPGDCSFQFDPVGRAQFLSSCDIAKGWLARTGLPYENAVGAPGATATVRIGDAALASFDASQVPAALRAARRTAWEKEAASFAATAGYPAAADSAAVNKPMVVAILFVLMVYAGMVYGPIAAALVEMFPANIRYTSMSLPYHIGNGWFGGFLPTTAFAMVAATGNIYYGLWYPVVVAAAAFVIGVLFIRETRHARIEA